jgi:multiple sugar transport system ATP-binding protein
MAKVELRGVSKVFGSVEAVKSVDLAIEDGSFFVILGPSGSGKTTILRIIAGLESPTSGKVIIGDKDVTDVPPKDRDVAMVFQNYALYPHMTVFQNLAFPLESRGIKKGEVRRRVEEVASLLRIEHLLNKKPSQLSGGEAQRVALGRAIIRRPKVFLMDEPLSNLDAKLRVYMRSELRKLQRTLRATFVYVTHDQVEAMSMADKVAVMFKGEIHQVGSPAQIYSDPQDTEVASFIGTPPMNLIRSKVIRVDKGEADIQVLGRQVKVKVRQNSHVRDGEEVIVGIRPEDLQISKDGALSGVVEGIEPLGRENILHVRLNESTLQVISTSTESIGEEIRLNFSCEKLILFDSKTNKRI